MRIRLLIIALALSAAAGQAAGASPSATTTQCIDGGGQVIPSVCQVPGSRIDRRELICTCLNGGQQVDVAICARGQTPPPEGKSLNLARRDGIKDGSLIGDLAAGKPICVAPRSR